MLPFGSKVFQNYYRLPGVYDCRRTKVDFIPFSSQPCAARTPLLTYYRFDRVVVVTAWRKGNGARGRRTYHQYFHRSRARVVVNRIIVIMNARAYVLLSIRVSL